VTTPQLAAAARRFFTTDKMVIVVVGDGPALLTKLKALGLPVRIVDVEGRPMTETDLRPQASDVRWQRERLVPLSLQYRVLVQGNPMGQGGRSLARATENGRDVLVLTSTMNIGPFVQQADTVTVDARTFAPIRVRQAGRVQGQEAFVRLDYDGGRARGTARAPGREGMRDVTVDTAVAAGTLDDNQLEAMVPALPLVAGGRVTVPVFSGGQGGARVMTLAVAGEESVTVPAGTFACWRVEVSGGDQALTFFVMKEAPYVVVKIEMAQAPVVIELTARQ
jgi:hypothetical protein